MNIFYFHVPKTAGSSINKFFSDNLSKHHFHIENVKNLDKEFCTKYNFLSGHVSYNRMDKVLDLKKWITFATFREPVSYTISHLKWVRKLADRGEEERFNSHPKIFQKIALKMAEYDFSQVNDIKDFIKWVESIDFYYFHNTQLHYMHQTNDQGSLSQKQIDIAIKNLNTIDFVGIQEELDDFMDIIAYEFGWEVEKKPKVNINDNNYGFDINNEETKKALLPLYRQDMIIYEEAKKLYNQQKNLYKVKEVENIIGFVDQITPKEVNGWARSKTSLKKLELELQVNGQTIQKTKANLFRQGLKTKGIHPTGFCSYVFDLSDIPLKNGDKISVNVKDNLIFLGNSNHTFKMQDDVKN